jgi:hypothetical protein
MILSVEHFLFSDLIPNIVLARGHGALKYLLYKRYIEVRQFLEGLFLLEFA